MTSRCPLFRLHTALAFACNCCADLPLGFGPDPAPIPQAVNQTPVAGAQDADAMRRQTGFHHERFKFRQEFVCHMGKLHAFACIAIPAIACMKKFAAGAKKSP